MAYTDTDMTKAEIVAEIAKETGIEKEAVQATVEAFMEAVKKSLEKNDNVCLKGFGSFTIEERGKRKGFNSPAVKYFSSKRGFGFVTERIMVSGTIIP